MLTDEQREVLSGALVPLYQYLEGWVIADVARRIKKTLSYARTAELEVIALRELGFSPAKIRAEAMKILRADKAFQRQVEENTLEYKREVARILKEINAAAATASEDVVEAAGKMAWEDDLSLWESAGAELKENGALNQIVNAMKRQTREELTNLTRSTGFRTVSGIEAVRDLYQKELDKAAVKMTSGVVTREQCVSDVVKELAHSGIRTVDYASGRSYQLDTAVRMCINTASGQIAAQVSDSNILNNGITLVRVSEHWGARNKGEGIQNHKEWQGKVYSTDGKAYPEEERRIGMEIRDLEDVTGYNVREGRGALEGLHGVNCRHNHTAWFEGISELPRHDPEPEPKEINGRTYTYYDMTQGMRRREREIRALKREREALDKLGENSKEIRAKIRQKTREYEKFCGDCGLRPQPARTRVESGSSDLTKTKAWKEYEDIVNAKKNGIIKVEKTSLYADPNSITQEMLKGGGINRNYYDEYGRQIKQVSNHNHGNAKRHPFGKSGEHAHDYLWENGKLVGRPARDLNNQEREENKDIL